MGIRRIDCRCHSILFDINDMDAFLLFVMPPMLGFGIYYAKKHDFVQFMIEYMKRKRKEK